MAEPDQMTINIKRIYEGYSPEDGWRILVDRVWPRGISKEKAHLDDWYKDLAPSNELRKWFGHIPAKFNEFARRYYQELDLNSEAQASIIQILAKCNDGNVTMLYSARDTEHNQAVVLRKYIGEKASKI